jgi:hypothetical protein
MAPRTAMMGCTSMRDCRPGAALDAAAQHAEGVAQRPGDASLAYSTAASLG